MSDPTARTLALLSLLQTHRMWRGADLADELRVSERTVRRDVDRLRGLGYPVDAEPGADGGYRLAVGAHLPPLLVTDDEAIALTVGMRATALSAIEGIEDASLGLMAKLDDVLPDRLRRRIDALQQSVEIMTWSNEAADIHAADLTVLSQGCRDGEEVRFTYHRRDGEESSRLVEPHQLVAAGRRWYLVAWDVRRNDWRTFRVDRMHDPTLAGVRFERRPLPAADASTFVRDGMQAMVAEHRVVLVVSASTEDLVALGHWVVSESAPTADGRSHVVVSGNEFGDVASKISFIASRFDVEIEDAPDGVRQIVAAVARRLSAGASLVDGPTRQQRP